MSRDCDRSVMWQQKSELKSIHDSAPKHNYDSPCFSDINAARQHWLIVLDAVAAADEKVVDDEGVGLNVKTDDDDDGDDGGSVGDEGPVDDAGRRVSG